MNHDFNFDESYEYLLNIFTEDVIYSRFENILTQIQDVLEGMRILDKVEVNIDLLGLAVLDYFEDIARIKNFQRIPRTNVDKIYSYGVYWLLRRNPIQILDQSLEKEFLHINEKVCVLITIPKMLEEMQITTIGNKERIFNYLQLMYYNFKYRTYTQQSLEFMIEAFFCGCDCFSDKESSVNG